MKFFSIILFVLLPLSAEANSKYDTSKLNPCLKKLYTRLIEHEKMIGETHTCDLSLKFANEKWLLFNDGYVRLDSTTKYSFLNFVKGMEIRKNVNTFRNVNVTFKIKTTTYSFAPSGWPVLGVQLIQIRPNKSLKSGTPQSGAP